MIKSAWKDFVETIYPAICKGCGTLLLKDEEVLCLTCDYDLPRTNYHLEVDNDLIAKFTGRLSLRSAAAMLHFSLHGKVQKLLHALKYKNRPHVAVAIGKLYAKEIKGSAVVEDIDFIVPVPLHPKKYKSRGYNQSTQFAAGLSEVLDIPVITNALIRVKEASSQTGKNRFIRFSAVENCFAAGDVKGLENKNILLVDDVITTGATIESCAKILQGIEGVEISILAIASRPLN